MIKLLNKSIPAPLQPLIRKAVMAVVLLFRPARWQLRHIWCRGQRRKVQKNIRQLFDLDYYSEQRGTTFSSFNEALEDYLENGFREGHDPHVLFDTTYYLDHYPEVSRSGVNPLVHFLLHSATEGQNPNPYFDTEFYYSRRPRLRENQANALVHYLAHAADGKSPNPNPLFGNGYYLTTYREVKGSGMNPLVHFIKHGCEEKRYVSAIHKNIVRELRGGPNNALLRGKWRSGTILLFSRGESRVEATIILQTAQALARDYRLNPLVVFFKRPEASRKLLRHTNVVILEELRGAQDIFRPSALHMLVKTFSSMNPLFSICGTQEILSVLRLNGIPTFYLCSESVDLYSRGVLEDLFRLADRVIFTSSVDFHSAAKKLGSYPTNVALLPYHFPPSELSGEEQQPTTREAIREFSVDEYGGPLLELAKRDFGLRARVDQQAGSVSPEPTKKIVIPATGWAISGVNNTMDYSSFIIMLARQRSGTNALRSVLNSNPDIYPVPEIFNNRMHNALAVQTSYFTFLEKFSRGEFKKVLLAENHAHIFLDYLEYLRCFTDKRYLILDIKYMSTHHVMKSWHFITEEPFFFTLIKEYNLPVINLTRKNLLRYYLSEMKTQGSHRWHEFDESVTGTKKRYATRKKSSVEAPERKITVDTPHLLETMRLCQAENRIVETSFADHERYLTFDYEDMFSHIGAPISDTILNRTAQFLGIEDNFSRRKPEYKKLATLTLEETIENYEEVAQVLRGTEFEYCLEDERMYANSS